MVDPIDELQAQLVMFISSQPGMVDKLLAAHADDGTGRCRSCSAGGQTGRYRWPCTIHRCAEHALATAVRR